MPSFFVPPEHSPVIMPVPCVVLVSPTLLDNMIAFSSKAPFVPNPAKDNQATRWIASLSDGSTVFEDLIPYERSAWRRLRNYVKLHGLSVTNLRLEAYGHRVLMIPYKDDNGVAQIEGYWHSKRIQAICVESGTYENQDCGIGYVKDGEIIITWVNQDGTIRQEVRLYRPEDEAVIIN